MLELLHSAVIAITVFSLVLLGLLVARPSLTGSRGGKGLAFLAFFILPVLVTSLSSA